MKNNTNLKIFLENIKDFKFKSIYLSLSSIICLLFSALYILIFILTSYKFTSDTTVMLDTPLKTFISYILLAFIFGYIGVNLFLLIKKTKTTTNLKYNIEEIKPKVFKYFIFLGLFQFLIFIDNSLKLINNLNSEGFTSSIFYITSVVADFMLLIFIIIIFKSVIYNTNFSKIYSALIISTLLYVILFLVSILFKKHNLTEVSQNDIIINFSINLLYLVFIILPFIVTSLSYVSKLKNTENN